MTVSKSSDEDDEIGDGLRTIANTGSVAVVVGTASNGAEASSSSNGVGANACGGVGVAQHTIVSHAAHMQATGGSGQVERRRRKLPEIPKNRKCKRTTLYIRYVPLIRPLIYTQHSCRNTLPARVPL